MKGQISFDYLAGAMVFFAAIIFLTSSVLNVMPAFEQANEVSELELTAWSVTEVLLNDHGYWKNSTGNGTDWEQHPDEVAVIGLSQGEGLSRDKIQTLLSMNYTAVRAVFDVPADFSLSITEYVPVDTYRSFEKNRAPSFITEPAYGASEARTVHYGTTDLPEGTRYVLLTDEIGWYNKVYLSQDWDFTDANVYNATDTRFVPIGSATYRLQAGQTQISEGNLLVLSRSLGRIGTTPPQDAGNVVSVNRYSTVNDHLIKLVMRAWS